MATQKQVDIRELIRANRATREVPAITEENEGEGKVSTPDPRTLRPTQRPRIAEDSGTYSVVFRR